VSMAKIHSSVCCSTQISLLVLMSLPHTGRCASISYGMEEATCRLLPRRAYYGRKNGHRRGSLWKYAFSEWRFDLNLIFTSLYRLRDPKTMGCRRRRVQSHGAHK
jgi:hypothetical protein